MDDESRKEGGSSSSSTEAVAMVFELHNGEADLVFCAVIMWLSVISIVIFSSVGGLSQPRQRSRDSRLVLPGEAGCRCGCCIGGAGVCGTYLS
ncbi:hypothetical protein C4D60_Mb07t11710 [Musa balbisiana]|uniref:Transmembrane protein n=1 Tax=Musa balbisiana TaxID=52838 RepID=A0A4S8JFU7_MUSBA|nr:hypothetical protein C4D60_Mb07t11710 [Musa balbisiana]